ncbi:hypothetical protein GCM10022200_14480 [Microbacterium awajiense]|uniref:Uncharacterized protein n=1 Tax=Microbacterium awajiense TaxID=415214 RepID=A0ABP7AIL6_9MICO
MADTDPARLRSAYSRMSWAALAVGGIASAVGGFVLGVVGGSSAPAAVAVVYAVIGAVSAIGAAGVVLLVLAMLRAYESSSMSLRLAVAAAAPAVVVALASSWTASVLSPPIAAWVALPTGLFAAAVGAGLAFTAERRAPHARRPQPRDHIPADAGLWPLAGGVASVVMGPATLWLLREVLHVNCGRGAPGTEAGGGWICADGISYLWAAILLGGAAVGIAVVGALVAYLVRNDRVAAVLLTLLAAFSVGWMLGWTWYGSSHLVWQTPPGVAGTDFWVAAVGPAALVASAAIGSAITALVFGGRTARLLVAVALGGMAVATVLQPGLAPATLVAAGALGGALRRSTVPRPEESRAIVRPERGSRT